MLNKRHQSKMPSSTKLTCKGTLRQVFISVIRLESGDTVSYVGIFDTALWTVAHLPFSLVQLSPPTPFPVWLCILYTRIQCVRGGGYGVLGLRRINTCRKVPLQVMFLEDDIRCVLPSLSLIFLPTSHPLVIDLGRKGRKIWHRKKNTYVIN